MAGACLILLLAPCAGNDAAPAEEPPGVEIAGEWAVRILPGTLEVAGQAVAIRWAVELRVEPATLIRVRDEKHDSLPLFDQAAAPWAKGAKLRALTTCETTAADLLVPESLALKSGPGGVARYAAGKDYAFDPRWAAVGRLPEGIPEDAPVCIDYDCGWGRLDAVVVARDGAVRIRRGAAHNATPLPPAVAADRERTLAHLLVPGRATHLTPENLYPILAERYAEPPREGPPPAAKLLPKTWAKLLAGEPLHVLAWGDSVTAGGEASETARRYQNRFAALLEERFPKSRIRLTTAGWGWRNSDHFLAEPPGAQFNFDRAVIEPRPDVVVMEFVNDAWMTPPVVEEKYSRLLDRFQAAGIEWVILTPHFVRPDWMDASSVRVETDPRPYVEGLRRFAAAHNVALADAALRWGHLLKEGIPYVTLLSNGINHPDDRGHEIFAQALIALFR